MKIKIQLRFSSVNFQHNKYKRRIKMENKTITLDGIEYELVLKEDTRTESEVEKSRFKPFDLTIRLNTIEEVKSLWNRLNISDKEAYEKNIVGGEGYKLDNDLDNEETPFYAEWDKVDDVLRELGEEPSTKRNCRRV